MESRDIQSYEEETVDLVHLAVFLLKKWRSLLVCILVGCLLGGLWQCLPKKDAERSPKDAALIEQMELAAMYRRQYEKGKVYIENSPFMALNGEALYFGDSEYYIAECKDPDMVVASFNAILADADTRSELCRILGIADETDLGNMVSVRVSPNSDTVIVGKDGVHQIDVREKANVFIWVTADAEEKAEQALSLLCDAVERLSQSMVLDVRQVSKFVSFGRNQDVNDAQANFINGQNDVLETCTTIESEFSEKEYKLYQNYVLAGKVDELPAELFPDGFLKKPVLLAAAFTFLACVWYVMQYFTDPSVKTADQMTNITKRNVICLVDETAPAKNAVDHRLDMIEASRFPAAVSTAYAVAALQKMDRAVVIYDEKNEVLSALAQQLEVPCMGLASQNAKTLKEISSENQIVLLAQLNETKKNQLQQECTIYRQYGLNLAGTILVK